MSQQFSFNPSKFEIINHTTQVFLQRTTIFSLFQLSSHNSLSLVNDRFLGLCYDFDNVALKTLIGYRPREQIRRG